MDHDNPYLEIGVQPFINCCGTRTIHSGTLILPVVQEAMLAASTRFVNMDELMAGVGRRLAELTGAEWGMITTGAAAALCHATAACVTGGDPEKMLRLPHTAGLENRVVMMADGRFTYDQAIRTVGVEIVEVSPDGLAGALEAGAAMVAFLGSREVERMARFAEMVALARAKNVPVLVDAAAEHLQRPDPYLQAGASMVVYSGGKYLRGPQASGLLLGRKKWVETAWTCAAPHHTLGRSMKVGKEEVMGLLAAVEYWADQRDHAAEQRQWRIDLETIADLVGRVESVTTAITPAQNPRSPVPRLQIRWDAARLGVSGLALRERLLQGRPRIMLDDRGATRGSIFILPFSLQPGEAEIVAQAISRALLAGPEPAPESRPPAVAMSGTWQIEIAFTEAEAAHRWTLEQDGATLRGRHQTLFLAGALSGSLSGDQIELTSQLPYEGTHLAYRFLGTVHGDTAAGVVELGSSGQAAPGPLNQREYGTAPWRGKRIK